MGMNSNARKYRTPTGGRSSIDVAPSSTGRGVDLVFRRSSEGEVLVRLTWSQAANLGKDIAALVATCAPTTTD